MGMAAGGVWIAHDPTSLTRSKRWSERSYEKFQQLSGDVKTGVSFHPATFYFKHRVQEHPGDLRKMNEFKDKVLGFVHDRSLIEKNGVNPHLGFSDAYQFLAPVIDTDIYMEWLFEEVKSAGCKIEQARVDGALLDQLPALQKRYWVDWIINCSGLGARELAKDDVSPLRGALVRLRNDIAPPLRSAHCVSHAEGQADPYFIFILPRGSDHILLGGLAEPNQWEMGIDLQNYGPVRQMYARCLEFLPALRNASLDLAEPVRAGLRPVRKQNVRLEQDGSMPLIHNYGHGGSGVTFSWGCAEEVARMII